MEIVTSERGKSIFVLMVIDTVEKLTKTGLIKWRCTFGNCRAVGYMDEQQEFTLETEHAHLPSPSKIQAKKLANEVREKAANTGNAPPPPDILSSTPKLTCLFMQRLQYRVTQHLFGV